MKIGLKLLLLGICLTSNLCSEASAVTITPATEEIIVTPSLNNLSNIEPGVVFQAGELILDVAPTKDSQTATFFIEVPADIKPQLKGRIMLEEPESSREIDLGDATQKITFELKNKMTVKPYLYFDGDLTGNSMQLISRKLTYHFIFEGNQSPSVLPSLGDQPMNLLGIMGGVVCLLLVLYYVKSKKKAAANKDC